MLHTRHLFAAAVAVVALTVSLTQVAHAGPGENVLRPGESLYPGQSLSSAKGYFRLTMQYDGNLVLDDNSGRARWASGTAGQAVSRLTMQTDGNLVIYGYPDAVWATHTNWPSPWSRLVLQDDGNLVIYGNVAAWSTGTYGAESPYGSPPQAKDTLAPGESLLPGQFLQSTDGRFMLIQQTDGNLVLYNKAGRALWASGTDGQAVTQTIMQTDGNLVIYGYSGALWSSRTDWDYGSFLTVQNDGNVVIYLPKDVWSTGTNQ